MVLSNVLAHKFIYGTAWKKDETTSLVMAAVESGFRALDTAAQPRHYREDLVGVAVRTLIAEQTVKRDELFVSIAVTLFRVACKL